MTTIKAKFKEGEIIFAFHQSFLYEAKVWEVPSEWISVILKLNPPPSTKSKGGAIENLFTYCNIHPSFSILYNTLASYHYLLIVMSESTTLLRRHHACLNQAFTLILSNWQVLKCEWRLEDDRLRPGQGVRRPYYLIHYQGWKDRWFIIFLLLRFHKSFSCVFSHMLPIAKSLI